MSLFLDVTPVAKTGLHCGHPAEAVEMDQDNLVTPVAKTGLHCGGPDFTKAQRKLAK